MNENDEDIEDTTLQWDDPIVKKFQHWAMMRDELESLTASLNKIRDDCMTALEERGARDHKGSQILRLPFAVGSKGFDRLKRERRVSNKIDEEVAEIICRSKGVYEKCFPARPTLDPDEIYVQYQLGVFTDEDMDNIFPKYVSYSFKPLS